MNLRSINTALSESPVAHIVTAIGCTYEAVAILTGWPSLSTLCWRHRILIVPLFTVLGLHLVVMPTVTH